MARSSSFGIAQLLGNLAAVMVLVWMQQASSSLFNSQVLVSVLAVVPLATVAAGFLYRLPQVAGVLLPPVREAQPSFSLDGIPAQSFLQGITYRVQMKNLWLLAVSPLLSFALWAAVAEHWIVTTADNPLPMYGAVGVVGIAMYVALRWLHERKLLKTNCSGIVQILGVGRTEVSYQFFDQHRERRGGTVRFKKPVAAGDLAPIFIDQDRPDNSRLFASFWFFQFQIVDCRHISPERLIDHGKR